MKKTNTVPADGRKADKGEGRIPIDLTAAELCRRLEGALSAPGDLAVTGFATDSREVKPGDAFLAIKGENVDGHQFVSSSLAAGAALSVVEKPVEGPHIFVPNLVEALAKLAASYRMEFHGPVIGVTGSAGKTTSKEMIAAACSSLGPVLKTIGNRNSEYTAPLLWTELREEHKAVVIEMGMRGPGQIRHLASFSLPNIAVVTNIGYSHLEFLKTRDAIAAAKGEILERLPESGAAILWQDDDYLLALREKTAAQTYTFGFSEWSDCRILGYSAHGWKESEFRVAYEGQTSSVRLKQVGRHLALNAACAILAAVQAGVSLHDAAASVSDAVMPPMRMQMIQSHGIDVLMDAYNASPPSMVAAIETVADVVKDGRKVALLGEMRELGAFSEDGHKIVGQSLQRCSFDKAILIGEMAEWIKEGAVEAGMEEAKIVTAGSIENASRFLEALEPGDTLLIKGSRALALERALDFLQKPAP